MGVDKNVDMVKTLVLPHEPGTGSFGDPTPEWLSTFPFKAKVLGNICIMNAWVGIRRPTESANGGVTMNQLLMWPTCETGKASQRSGGWTTSEKSQYYFSCEAVSLWFISDLYENWMTWVSKVICGIG